MGAKGTPTFYCKNHFIKNNMIIVSYFQHIIFITLAIICKCKYYILESTVMPRKWIGLSVWSI